MRQPGMTPPAPRARGELAPFAVPDDSATSCARQFQIRSFASVSSLPGIGPKLVKLLTRLLGGVEPMGARVIDALFHLPTGVLDRRLRPKLAEAPLNVLVMVEVRVERHRASSGKGPYRVYCSDETGDLTLAFFAPQAVSIERALPVGERRWVSGKIELFDGMRQMTHPDRIVDETDPREPFPLVEPVYPLTEGLYPRQIQKATQEALTKAPDLPEWQDAAWLKAQAWVGFRQSLASLHSPHTPTAVALDAPARLRLAYDELLASQLALAMVGAHNRALPGQAVTGTGEISARIEGALPFNLARAKIRALVEIRADMAGSTRMLRLLQGDVGSGKTVVALLAMATMVEGGRQAALMAPTEILARQHLATIGPLAETAGLRIGLMTGRDRRASASTCRALSRRARSTSS